ncbi:MAG: NAD-dependent epimerase/dehydratase family protein [Deltaproteobacteria bacterium]|nr:NAD-dependent epimerase/dehydratase family protein [Deltaproteobacteria bacterium]
MKGERILLTGGAGFIGLRLARRLAEAGAKLTLVDDLSRGRRDEEAEAFFARPDVTFVQGDLCDPATLERAGGPFDTIVHLAAVIGIQVSEREPVRVLRTNAISTIRVVDRWLAQEGGRLVFASTSEVYGALLGAVPLAVPSPESVPVGVRDTGISRYSYAASKIFGETLVRQAAQAGGRTALVVRPHNVYGPRMGWNHVIPQMSLRALRGEDPFRVFGADETRAFCHIDDFTRAVELLLERDETGLFHVGTDRETRIGDLARMLLEAAGHRVWTVDVPSQQGSPPRRCPDLGKLRAATGYEPQVTLEAGLAETFAWYKRHAEAHPEDLQMEATP